jgi:uncharacterized protein (DUF1697 family)
MMSEKVYVALLRGINVGGHNVKMDALRGHFGELGFTNVRSYIQSGNVFFESAETDRRKLRETIETHLQSALGYAVPTCLRTVDDLEAVLARDPFHDVEVTPDIRLSVNFLAEPSVIDLPLPYQTSDGAYELIDRTDSELFVVWHLQNGRPGNSYGQIEKQLKVPVTVRFWHTTAKILAAAKVTR